MKTQNTTHLKIQDEHLWKISYLADHDKNIFALSSILSDQVASKFKNHLQKQLNLTLVDWRVIATLMRNPDFTAVDITNHWGMDKMIINRSIKRLEKHGLLVRERDLSDRRSYNLKATTKGKLMFSQVAPKTHALYSSYMDVLTKEEQQVLLKSMLKVITHLSELPD